MAKLQQREDQVFLVLALVIGALTGLTVVAFILLTEREGLRLYPAGGAPWRRVLFPVAGSLGIGYLLFRYFPNARGSGVPQTKAALFAREGRITLRTVLGKFFAHRQRWPAESRWGAKGLRCKWARASLPCWDAAWDCGLKK
jgi:CIC family chloride channel protein